MDLKKQEDGEYHCIFLTDRGCRLPVEKPFKCSFWPLYLVRDKGRMALAVSKECAHVYGLMDEEIWEGIKDQMPHILETVEKYPQLVEEMKDYYRILKYF